MKIEQQSAETVSHLVKLHVYLNSGTVQRAARDWLQGEINQIEDDIGLEPRCEHD